MGVNYLFLYFLAQGARVVGGEPGFDHIEDVAVVASFLSQAEKSDNQPYEIEIRNRNAPRDSNYPAFLAYARECSIDKIYAIPSAEEQLPISVVWSCGRFIEVDGKPKWEDRNAGFRVRDGVIVTITFGDLPTVNIPLPGSK